VSLLIGTSITLLIALMRAGGLLPESIDDVVLRPGAYAARAAHLNDMGGALIAALGDGIVIGLVPLGILRINHWRRDERPLGQARSLPLVDRRKSSREPLAAQVFVYGYLRGEPFAEMTNTVNVSANGSLLKLSVQPAALQELMLINPDTDAQLRCRVTRSTMNGEKSVTGVEFLAPSADFWLAKPAKMTA
jgi:hypothetical protein